MNFPNVILRKVSGGYTKELNTPSNTWDLISNSLLSFQKEKIWGVGGVC